MSPRLVFAGTPDFALASLKALVESGHRPVAVYTQPDRPAGRGKKLTASPVKAYALEQGIEVRQPRTLKDDEAAGEFAALEPDLFIVAAYGLLLPQRILDIPTHGCVNVHASVLPRWRGAAPIQAAIREGDAETGISLMAMTAGLDEGPVFVSSVFPIGSDETAGELHDRLATLGGELLTANIDALSRGELRAEPQDDAKSTYAGKIATRDAALDWSKPAGELRRQVLAYNPVPGCFFEHDGQRIKVWNAESVDGHLGEPGLVVSSDADGVVVACGDGALCLSSLQRPGKGRVNAREFTAALDLTGQVLSD